MKLGTIVHFLRQGRLRPLFRANRLGEACYRTWWLAAAARNGVLRRLSDGASSLDALAEPHAPRLPEPEELVAQLAEAGFGSVRARKLVPGERYYAFSAVAP